MTKGEPKFELNIALRIPPGGALNYEYLYEAWSDDVDTHIVGANRFIDDVVVEIHNITNRSIAIERDVDCKKSGRRSIPPGQNITLNKGETASFKFEALPPTEDISFIQRLVN